MADKDDKDRDKTIVQRAVQIGLIGIPIVMYVTWVYKIFRPCPRVKCNIVPKKTAKKKSKLMCAVLNSLSKRMCQEGAKEKYEDPCFGYNYEKYKGVEEEDDVEEEEKTRKAMKRSNKKKCVSSFYEGDLEETMDVCWKELEETGSLANDRYHAGKKTGMNSREREQPCRENTTTPTAANKEGSEQESAQKTDGVMRSDVSVQPVPTAVLQHGQQEGEKQQSKEPCITEKPTIEKTTVVSKNNDGKQCEPIQMHKRPVEKKVEEVRDQNVDILAALEAFGEQLTQKYTSQLKKAIKEIDQIRETQNNGKPMTQGSKRECCKGGAAENEIQPTGKPASEPNQKEAKLQQKPVKNENVLSQTNKLGGQDDTCDQNFHSGDVDTPFVVKDYKCDSSRPQTEEESENKYDKQSSFWNSCSPPKGLKRGCRAEQCQDQSAKGD